VSMMWRRKSAGVLSCKSQNDYSWSFCASWRHQIMYQMGSRSPVQIWSKLRLDHRLFPDDSIRLGGPSSSRSASPYSLFVLKHLQAHSMTLSAIRQREHCSMRYRCHVHHRQPFLGHHLLDHRQPLPLPPPMGL
jgi:hypothetical protein